jgi:type III secretion protein Q
VLLPPDYPAAQGTLRLDLPGGRTSLRLTLAGGQATIVDIQALEDSMPEDQNPQNQPPEPAPEAMAAPRSGDEAAPAAGPDLTADLELTVTFELERKLMTLAEISALAPGAAFPLGTDPLAPVTLTVGGRALARGRLVDMGGVLGVQVTAIVSGADRG